MSVAFVGLCIVSLGCREEDRCGPSSGVVTRVIDGDTVELESGDRIRYIGIDTPESTNGADDCYGSEAADRNRELVEGMNLTIDYDAECTDRYDRLLAYISVDGDEINRRLIVEGYACTLFIPPNGAERKTEFEALESQAMRQEVGMWGECEEITCD